MSLAPHFPALRRAPVVALTLGVLAPGLLGCGDPRLGAPVEPRVAPVAARPAARSADAGPAAVTRRRLERAAAGLLYTSESDYPFDYVALAAAVEPPPTIAAFRAAAGLPDDTPVEQQTLDAFFARHIERVDPADATVAALVPRYRRLKRVLRTSLRGTTVFRVGRIAVRCYVVGVDARGHLVGLATTAIET